MRGQILVDRVAKADRAVSGEDRGGAFSLAVLDRISVCAKHLIARGGFRRTATNYGDQYGAVQPSVFAWFLNRSEPRRTACALTWVKRTSVVFVRVVVPDPKRTSRTIFGRANIQYPSGRTLFEIRDGC